MNRYKNIQVARNVDNTLYRRNPIYPTIQPTLDDIYVITSVGDRYDTLAQQFYNNSALWWIIAMSNNYNRGSLVVEPGVQLRIPADPSFAVSAFENLNKTR